MAHFSIADILWWTNYPRGMHISDLGNFLYRIVPGYFPLNCYMQRICSLLIYLMQCKWILWLVISISLNKSGSISITKRWISSKAVSSILPRTAKTMNRKESTLPPNRRASDQALYTSLTVAKSTLLLRILHSSLKCVLSHISSSYMHKGSVLSRYVRISCRLVMFVATNDWWYAPTSNSTVLKDLH